MALTSNGTVGDGTIEFDASKRGGRKVAALMAYITVVLNTAVDVSAIVEFKEDSLDAYFPFQTIVGNTFTDIIPEFPADGKYRLPVPFARNEDAVRLTFNNLGDADIDVQFLVADVDKQID